MTSPATNPPRASSAMSADSADAPWWRQPAAPAPAHILPFAGWIVWLLVDQFCFDGGSGVRYALRTLTGLALLLWLRPWRWYPAPQWRHLPLALGIGCLVWVVWVVPESELFDRWPDLKEFYLRWLVMPFGRLPVRPHPSPYDPAVCGWALTAIRLAGSAFVIAVIEEFFFRGFLYRWLSRVDFLKQPLTRFAPLAFLWMILIFGAEHEQWAAGIFAGAAYGWLTIRTGNIWAAAWAHVLTNLLLGLYVIGSGRFGFW